MARLPTSVRDRFAWWTTSGGLFRYWIKLRHLGRVLGSQSADGCPGQAQNRNQAPPTPKRQQPAKHPTAPPAHQGSIPGRLATRAGLGTGRGPTIPVARRRLLHPWTTTIRCAAAHVGRHHAWRSARHHAGRAGEAGRAVRSTRRKARRHGAWPSAVALMGRPPHHGTAARTRGRPHARPQPALHRAWRHEAGVRTMPWAHAPALAEGRTVGWPASAHAPTLWWPVASRRPAGKATQGRLERTARTGPTCDVCVCCAQQVGECGDGVRCTAARCGTLYTLSQTPHAPGPGGNGMGPRLSPGPGPGRPCECMCLGAALRGCMRCGGDQHSPQPRRQTQRRTPQHPTSPHHGAHGRPAPWPTPPRARAVRRHRRTQLRRQVSLGAARTRAARAVKRANALLHGELDPKLVHQAHVILPRLRVEAVVEKVGDVHTGHEPRRVNDAGMMKFGGRRMGDGEKPLPGAAFRRIHAGVHRIPR